MDENWNGKKGKQKDTERQNKANRKDWRTSKNTYIHEKKYGTEKEKHGNRKNTMYMHVR